ncbi:Hypothetical protein CINCED_3A021222 [Cinara cedri]|uniref:Daxx histone-binding domain-containing protein n=1 Tax=Cinara cedri TaxID=506608 RepID=A0A5E4NPZ3_9HEMI|nr:Hypothetical protein CINCED_3A021222 [Cinara cedri]
MLHIDISSDEHENDTIESDGSINGKTGNMEHFQQMIKLCKKNKWIPQKYIDDMNKMYKQCSDKQRSSKKLCNLIVKGTENITSKSENSFQYAANVYNELLQLSKMDSLKNENNVAGTSKGFSNINIELESEKNNISMSNKIFNEFIEKCYQNANFPNQNIQLVDKLYRSLAPEFVESKYFLLLLKEANQAIWPDSSVSLYIHVEHVYNQLLQFHSSMEIQDKKVSGENNKMDKKKYIKLQKLIIALKKIRKHIKILNEKEMDINDEDQFNSDSAYLLKDKFEKKIVEIYKRICSLTDEPSFLDEPRMHFKQTSNKLVNRTIEKYYNEKKIFPDYFEIYTLLKMLKTKKNLNWTEAQLKNISQDAFLKLGKQLKIKRLNEYFGRLEQEITEKDPAVDDIELQKKLDESQIKLNEDLNALTEEFINKQDYVVETEDSSSSSSTDCEKSLEDEFINDSQYFNEKLKSSNIISIRRKRLLSNNTENDKPNTISSEDECINKNPHCNKKFKITNPVSVECKRQFSNSKNNDKSSKKNKKSIHMKNLDLIPRVITLNEPNVVSNQEEKISIENKKVPGKIVKENSNEVINKNISISIQKCNDSDGNLAISNAVEGKSIEDNEGYCIRTIDKDINVDYKTDEIIENKKSTNEVMKDGSSNNSTNISTITIDGVNNDIGNDTNINNATGNGKGGLENCNITEPRVTIHQEEIQPKDIIEINDNDDSDIEITSCDSPKVPVKQNLYSVIKSMNFDKPYNWDPHVPRPNHSNSGSSREFQHQRSVNPNSSSMNLEKNLVNCWVMNNTHNVQSPRSKNPRPTNNIRQTNSNYSRLHQMTPRMQSTPMVRNSMAQRGKNVTKHYNTQTRVQNRHNFSNNRSRVQQQTMMTTTTMVQQSVHQSQPTHQMIDTSKKPIRSSRVTSSHSINNNDNPELIELD